jgi:hypothetical protein
MDAEARFEATRVTAEMVGLVEQLLAGRTTRHELYVWAEKLVYPHRPLAFHTAAARGLLSCLLDLHSQLDDGPRVRDVDLAAHVEAIRMGWPPFDPEAFATLALTAREVATRIGREIQRYYVDGLGWMEICEFASPATGRRFSVHRPLHDAASAMVTRVSTFALPPAAADRAAVLADLFDTLTIDMDEITWSDIAPSERWRLMRSDDNGNTQLVRRFSGYAKARKALAEYEAKLHKQAYWLERED